MDDEKQNLIDMLAAVEQQRNAALTENVQLRAALAKAHRQISELLGEKSAQIEAAAHALDEKMRVGEPPSPDPARSENTKRRVGINQKG